jgi:hypothetical protein
MVDSKGGSNHVPHLYTDYQASLQARFRLVLDGDSRVHHGRIGRESAEWRRREEV